MSQMSLYRNFVNLIVHLGIHKNHIVASLLASRLGTVQRRSADNGKNIKS
jgi:hypothetical protein